MMGAFGTMNPDECISMDDLHCTGNENNIGKCHHSGETGHNCQHSEDAAVDCNTCTITLCPSALYSTTVIQIDSQSLQFIVKLNLNVFLSVPYDVKLESITRTSDYVLGVLMVSNDDRETYGAITDCFDFPTWNRNATEYVNDCVQFWVFMV